MRRLISALVWLLVGAYRLLAKTEGEILTAAVARVGYGAPGHRDALGCRNAHARGDGRVHA